MDESVQRHLEVGVEPWRKVLLDAADLIERDGLWKGCGSDYSYGSNCIANAISKITGEPYTASHQKLLDSFGCGLKSFNAVYAWNDAPERTASEVIAKLREVAQS